MKFEDLLRPTVMEDHMGNVIIAVIAGVAFGGLGAVVYFSYTGTQLKWKK